MYRYIKLFIFLMVVGHTLCVHSQPFRNLSVKDGLPDLVVNTIYKDSLGYLWFGTSSSVERFDGNRFKHYPVPEVNDRSRDVNAIIEMPQGEIWFGNSAGLWRIGSDDRLARVAADSITEKVYALVRRDSLLYIGTHAGLFILRGGRAQRVLLGVDALSAANVIRGLALDEERLWMATSQGLYAMRLSDRGIESYRPRDEKMNVQYVSAYLHQGMLYLPLQEWGVVPFHLQSRTFGRVIPIGPVTGLTSSPKESLLYAATNGRGIYALSVPGHRIVRQIVHRPDSDEGIRSNSVYSILADREGILWAGLFQFGVDYSLYRHQLFSVYAPGGLDALRHGAIRCMASADSTRVIGTRDGLYFIDASRQQYRSYAGELRAPMVMSACFYQGQYYIGTFGGGMYVLNPRTGELADFDATEETFVHGQVFSITPDADGCLWIGTNAGLYAYRDGRQVLHYTEHNSRLPHSDVYRIFFDSSRRGWLCTAQGMALLDSAEPHIVHTRFPQHFAHQKLIRDIYETSDHHLYFCPDRGDLFVSDLSLGHFRSLPIPALQGRSLQFLIEDDEQWLWIGTNDGLFRYDRQGAMESYSSVDGLLTTNFLNCLRCRDADGTLWFGSSQGLYTTDTRRIRTKWTYPYPLRFTEAVFEDNGHRLVLPHSSGTVTLPSTHGKLILQLSDFTYTDPREVSFEYRLDDDQWRTLAGTSELTLYNLTGRRQLQLRHCGVPDSLVTLHIAAPRLTPGQWAWMVSALLAVGFVLLLFRRRRVASYKLRAASYELPAASYELPATSYELQGTRAEDVPPLQTQKLTNLQTQKLTNLQTQDLTTSETQKYKQVNLSDDDCRELARSLDRLMQLEKPYLNPKLKLTDLGQMLQVPTYKLSYLFNQYLDRPFYDYINEFRIREFKSLVAEGRNKSYTINTLTEQCGFTSRTTFFRYFKQFTGMTPNEYINQSEHPESSRKSVD